MMRIVPTFSFILLPSIPPFFNNRASTRTKRRGIRNILFEPRESDQIKDIYNIGRVDLSSPRPRLEHEFRWSENIPLPRTLFRLPR